MAIIKETINICTQRISLQFTNEYFSSIYGIFTFFSVDVHLMAENEISPLNQKDAVVVIQTFRSRINQISRQYNHECKTTDIYIYVQDNYAIHRAAVA